uniref:Uncharacterized protein n=1 Tax=Anguilla anguilla TaxID=7936 RepID=A0A0E9RZW7_ANGAN
MTLIKRPSSHLPLTVPPINDVTICRGSTP